MDGVELLGVTSVLESRGLSWSIYPTMGLGVTYHDGSLEVGKLKWILANGYADIGFCSFWWVIYECMVLIMFKITKHYFSLLTNGTAHNWRRVTSETKSTLYYLCTSSGAHPNLVFLRCKEMLSQCLTQFCTGDKRS